MNTASTNNNCLQLSPKAHNSANGNDYGNGTKSSSLEDYRNEDQSHKHQPTDEPIGTNIGLPIGNNKLKVVVDIVDPYTLQACDILELLDPTTDANVYAVISKLMIHGSCGYANPNATCMKDGGSCSRNFPKPYCDKTYIDKDGFVHYRRRDTEIQTQRQNVWLDNRGRNLPFLIWGEMAKKFDINEYDKIDKSVIIAVSSAWATKRYGGLQLSSTSTTHYYLNPNFSRSKPYSKRAIIDDGTATATIICFSPEAHTFVPDCIIIVNTIEDKDTNHVPPVLKQAEGHVYIFQHHFGQKARPGYPNLTFDAVLKPLTEPLLALPAAEPLNSPAAEILKGPSIGDNPTTTDERATPSAKNNVQVQTQNPEGKTKKQDVDCSKRLMLKGKTKANRLSDATLLFVQQQAATSSYKCTCIKQYGLL
nr:DNA helicase [Tanacetum cinerariifolium]